MGIFDLFRKRTTREDSKQDVHLLALAYLEEAYKRMAGEPLSLGVKHVCFDLLSCRPAEYKHISTPEKFRLGVISHFALLAAMSPKLGMFGMLYTTGSASDELYLQDRYGTNRISAEEYLTAFGISIIQHYEHKFINNKEKVLAIVPESVFNSLGGAGGDMCPIVKDDGKVAVVTA